MTSGGAPRMEILVPFWGDPELLYAAVDSVRAQTVPDWVAVIIDDAYPDPSVAEHFAREKDPRIHYVRNESNLGIAANFQKALDLASGEFITFFGCDDLLAPDYVERALTTLARHPRASILQPGVQVIDDEGRPWEPLADRIKRWLRPKGDDPVDLAGEQLAASLLRGNWLYWPSLVFRAEQVKRYRFRQDLPIVLDLALVLEQVADGAQLVYDPAVTFRYRRHAASLSGKGLVDGSRFADDRRYFAEIAQVLGNRGWRVAARAARTRWTSRLHGLSLVPTALRAGDLPGVRAALRHALTR